MYKNQRDHKAKSNFLLYTRDTFKTKWFWMVNNKGMGKGTQGKGWLPHQKKTKSHNINNNNVEIRSKNTEQSTL